MVNPALLSVFQNAAPPQKAVMFLLVAAIPITAAAAICALSANRDHVFWTRVVTHLGMAGPALGLLVGGLDSFHIADTVRRLPYDPTLKQVAPGIFEVSTLVSLGAAVGLVALIAYATVSILLPRQTAR